MKGVGHIGRREARRGAELGRAVRARNIHAVKEDRMQVRLSFRSEYARCTATTAPLCASSRVLVRKRRWYQPSTESTNRRVIAPSSGAS